MAAPPGSVAVSLEQALSGKDGSVLPVCLAPEGGAALGPAAAAEWIADQRDGILALAAEHGAVLLRGFGIEEAEHVRPAPGIATTLAARSTSSSSPRPAIPRSSPTPWMPSAWARCRTWAARPSASPPPEVA